MPTKHTIEFVETDTPITEAVTKFGGQPVWVDGPAWPLSRETGNQMRFIGQIELGEKYGLTSTAKMAYLFMTEEEDGEFVDGTYEPDGGENAVILQPGVSALPISDQAEGPTLFKMVKGEGNERLQPQPCEFAVKIKSEPDHEFVSEAKRAEMPDEEAEATRGKLDENKIGGSLVFMQGDEFPFPEECQLLLQLDTCSVPFYVNFGDARVAYAFLNADGSAAKFLWQCG